MTVNFRHLRVFLAVADSGSVTRAAEQALVSQPAVTQAIAKLEREAETPLFVRTPQGLHPTPAGEALAKRVRRAFGFVDGAFQQVSPRLRLTATAAQLRAVIAVQEAESFTLAARRLGIAQPTVHRAVTQVEQEVGRALFQRSSNRTVATRPGRALAQAARLAFAELAQAEADVAGTLGREVGRIVVGAMPLSRSAVLPAAIVRFRKRWSKLPIQVLDGRYDDLLAGLRRGEIDFLVGALRDPAPAGDVEQRPLFHDSIVLVAGRGHPLVGAGRISVADLARYPWVVAPAGTPTRAHFDRLFAGLPGPAGLVESGSLILMRELLEESDHLGCISRLQARAETDRALMVVLPFEMDGTLRPIGLTLRSTWLPTQAQREFLSLLQPWAG